MDWTASYSWLFRWETSIVELAGSQPASHSKKSHKYSFYQFCPSRVLIHIHTAKQYKDTQTVVKVIVLGFAVSTSQHPQPLPLKSSSGTDNPHQCVWHPHKILCISETPSRDHLPIFHPSLPLNLTTLFQPLTLLLPTETCLAKLCFDTPESQCITDSISPVKTFKCHSKY